jgi:hypothetical protein
MSSSATTELTVVGNQVNTGSLSITGSIILGASASIFTTTLAGSTGQSIFIGLGGLSSSYFAPILGFYNYGFGYNALASVTNGYGNVALGWNSLRSTTTGYQNVAVGQDALSSSISGYQNVAIGLDALSTGTDQAYNVAIGYLALKNLRKTGGASGANVGIGYGAGLYASAAIPNTGSLNSVYLGFNTRTGQTDANNEVVIGAQATGNGSNSVTLGHTSITKTILRSNVGIGTTAPTVALEISAGSIKAGTNSSTEGTVILQDSYSSGNLTNFGTNRSGGGAVISYASIPSPVTTNQFVSTFSSAAARSAIIVQDNISFYTTGSQTITSGSAVIMAERVRIADTGQLSFFRYTATSSFPGTVAAVLAVDSSGNVITTAASGSTGGGGGSIPGGANTTIQFNDSNAFSGSGLFAFNKTTNVVTLNNMLIGRPTVTGGTNYNIFIGTGSLAAHTTGSRNVAIGDFALNEDTITNDNTAVGYGALSSQTTPPVGRNSGFGSFALYLNKTGQANTAVGYASLYRSQDYYNVGLGDFALFNLTSGSDNTGVGQASGYALRSGSNNILIGRGAAPSLLTGSNNTIIGSISPDTNVTTPIFGLSTGSNNTIIGANISGLSSVLNDNIILATGQGDIRYRWNGTTNTFTGSFAITSSAGSFTYDNATGRVGINTNNSTYRLTISSSTEDSYAGFIGPSPSVNLAVSASFPLYTGTFGLATLNNAYLQGSTPGDVIIQSRGLTSGSILFGFGSAQTARVRITNTGNLFLTSGSLGVNTTSPSASLHVVGNTILSGSLIVSGSTHGIAEHMILAISDETTNITTGTAKVTFRAPFAMTLTQIPRSSLSTASSSGLVTVDINENGTTILGANKLSIDANEKTSTTAATPTTLADTIIADDAEITIDIDAAGTGARGLKVTLYYIKT